MRIPGRLLLVSVIGGATLLGSCSSDSGTTSPTVAAATPDGSFCTLLLAFRTTNDSLEGEVNSGDSARAETAVRRLVSQSELLRTKAPAEISADVAVVAAYVTSLDRLLADHGYDIDAFVGDEEASAAFIELTTDDVDSSLLQLRTYAETVCAPAAGGSTTTVVPPAPG